MNNYRLTVAYDGSRYSGWQRQGNTDGTIQGRIETALTEIFGHRIEINGSGRTDAGTHARGQTASFRGDTFLPPDRLLEEINRRLPGDIAVTGLELAPERFHARLSVKGKTYVYRIWTEPWPNVFERKFMYHLGKKPDTAAMEKAAALMCRRADFIGYSSLKKSKKSTVRTVRSIQVLDLGSEVRLVFNGDGFLYNMVRIMAGTLVEVGLGRRSAESVARPFETLNRADAGETLPAWGLTLEKVEY